MRSCTGLPDHVEVWPGSGALRKHSCRTFCRLSLYHHGRYAVKISSLSILMHTCSEGAQARAVRSSGVMDVPHRRPVVEGYPCFSHSMKNIVWISSLSGCSSLVSFIFPSGAEEPHGRRFGPAA